MKELYKPFKSQAKNKKYSVYVKKGSKVRLIHFGDKRYQHFKDKLKVYSNLDTNDNNKKRLYYARHGYTKDKNTAKYWANKILW